MYNIGFERIGIFDHISKATDTGIATVFHPILADRAEDITGATIKATTAGRIPINILDNVSLLFIRSGVRNIAIQRIIVNDGNIVPADAATAPFMPRSLSPTATEILTASIPGRD